MNGGTQRGLLVLLASVPKTVMDQIAAAQSTATQAQQTANAAKTASQTADQSATSLANAVATGNEVHTALSNRITALVTRVTAVGTGRITVALILGGSVDVTITLSRTMPNTSYTVDIAPTNGFTFGTPKNKTATTVTIPVTAGLALAIGASFTILATG